MQFHKYQGTGNDFVLIDNRSGELQLTAEQIEQICHRRFGIGADGLMLLNEHAGYDFEMKYFNADGRPGSLCGNGSRCIIRFAYDIGIQKNMYCFLASDGPHQAELFPNGQIRIHMNDVEVIQTFGDDLFMNTGSPHVVRFVAGLQELDVYNTGKSIRYHEQYAPGGTNVNFLERTPDPNRIYVRTYERGVEDETYSCGTGVTACALALAHSDRVVRETIVDTKGGQLMVQYKTADFTSFQEICLTGPATKVFHGEIDLS
jgi:diaminopimelate epimerase